MNNGVMLFPINRLVILYCNWWVQCKEKMLVCKVTNFILCAFLHEESWTYCLFERCLVCTSTFSELYLCDPSSCLQRNSREIRPGLSFQTQQRCFCWVLKTSLPPWCRTLDYKFMANEGERSVHLRLRPPLVQMMLQSLCFLLSVTHVSYLPLTPLLSVCLLCSFDCCLSVPLRFVFDPLPH